MKHPKGDFIPHTQPAPYYGKHDCFLGVAIIYKNKI